MSSMHRHGLTRLCLALSASILTLACSPASTASQRSPQRFDNVIQVDGRPRFAIGRYEDLSCRAEIVEFVEAGKAPVVLVGTADGYDSLHFDEARNSLFYFRDADDDPLRSSPSCLPGADLSGSGPYEFIARYDLKAQLEHRTAGLFYLPMFPRYSPECITLTSHAYLRFDPSNVWRGRVSDDIGDNEAERTVVGSRNGKLRDFCVSYDDLTITRHSIHIPESRQ